MTLRTPTNPMKRLLLLAALAASNSIAHAAPTAILTRVRGQVSIQRGAQKLAAREGLQLQNGDKISVKNGAATIFSLGAPPQTIQNGTIVIGAKTAQRGSPALWKGVYNGLSSGLSRGDRRIAATMRPGRIEPISPSQTLLESGRPLFSWRDENSGASRYEIRVLRGNSVVWRAQTDQKSLQYPSTAPLLAGNLSWQIVPLESQNGVQKPIESQASRAVSFQIAPPALVQTTKAEIAQLNAQMAKSAPLDRVLARAGLWNARGFRDAALRELLGANDDAAARELRRAIQIESGQFVRPETQTAPILASSKIDGAILSLAPDAPIAGFVRKTYALPEANFSIAIPVRFAFMTQKWARGAVLTEFGAAPQNGARLSIVTAPARDFGANDSLLNHFLKVFPDIRGEKPRDAKFQNQQARAAKWSGLKKATKSVGETLEWTRGETRFLAVWGGENAAQTAALRPLLEELKPAKATAISFETLPDELMETMKNALGEMQIVNERQQKSFFQAPQKPAPATLAELAGAEKARLLTPENSYQRSETARESAKIAARLAWQAIEAGKNADAPAFFAQRAALENESYRAQVAAIESDLRAGETEIARLRAITPPQYLAQSYGIAFEGLMSLKAMRLTMWRSLALAQNDTDGLEKTSRLLWDFRLAAWRDARLESDAAKVAERARDLAVALEDLGDVAQERVDLGGARALFARALLWRRALPPAMRRDIEKALRNRAVLESEIGEVRLARDFYEQTLAEQERVKPAREKEIEGYENPQIREYLRVDWQQDQSVTLNNLGVTTQNLGDYTAAETYLQRALAVIEVLPETGFSGSVRAQTRASTLGNLAVLRADAGDLAGGAKFLNESAEIYRSIGGDAGLALALFNGAGLDYERSDSAAALSKIAAARSLFSQLQIPLRVVAADVFAAKLARQAGDFESATRLSQSALVLARTLGDPMWRATAARGLASAKLEMGKMPLDAPTKFQILTLLSEAETASERSASAFDGIANLALRAKLEEKSGETERALDTQKAAIARLERVRATTASGESFSDLRENYALYDDAVRLLLQLKRPEEAFDMLGRARSKRLRDALQVSAQKSGDLTLATLVARAAALDEKLAKTRARLASEESLPAPKRDTAKIENLTLLLASTQQQFFEVGAQIKARNPRFERALSLSPRELKKAQRAIPVGALLLQYAVLDDGIYIFAVTHDSLKIYAPKISKTELNAAIRSYRGAVDADIVALETGKTVSSIDDLKSPLRIASQTLSNALLSPVQAEIDAAKIVAVVPSGELFYLPFHALGEAKTDGKWKFLIEEKPVAYLASGDVLAIAQERDEDSGGRGVLALGNPTGADLPAAQFEVEQIARIFPGSRALTGENASKSEFLKADTREKRVLHLAAHGVLNSLRPDQSWIQLSPSTGDDGKLRVGEIIGLDLNKVDLVTLSACQTALGEGEPDGTEISSLAESFSSAGTPSVVASLWNVEDKSTSRLMETFYGALADGTPKGIALQRAQIALLRDEKTRNPVFWAPFELLGDWR